MADFEEVLHDKIRSEVAVQNSQVVKSLRNDIIAAAMEELKAARPIELITVKGIKKRSGGIVHEMTEEVLTYISARVPLLLVGPAGSGKTHIAITCATMLNLPY